MQDLGVDGGEIRGWIKVGPQSYQHHCGARVAKRGRLWTASGVAGTAFGGHLTALEAMSCLEGGDSSFWSYGDGAVIGILCSGVRFALGNPDDGREDGAFVCHLAGEDCFPEFINAAFKRYLFGKLNCARCLMPMTKLQTRALLEFDGSGSTRNLYFVCDCGHPAWNLKMKSFHAATLAIRHAEKSWRRNQRVKVAGGAHTSTEIREILALQDNRCIYCNTQFTSEIRPTKDHLLGVADGGGKWALNIVIACGSCNSRRSDIPFRTYCSLLSQKQNQRILTHLRERLLVSDLRSLPDEALVSFDKGLASYDAEHPRFLDIQNRSGAARHNVFRNQPLPRTRSLILKTASAIRCR